MWAHDRANRKDDGEWYWGGEFCIPHEVEPMEDGSLAVKMPEEYTKICNKKIDWKYLPITGEAKLYGESLLEMKSIGKNTYGFLDVHEKSFFFECKVMPREVGDYFGILLKSDREASGCLLLEFDMAMQRVSLLNLPMAVDPFWEASCQAVPPAKEPGPDGVRVCEKSFAIESGKEIEITGMVDNDLIELFIDRKVAFTYRSYAEPEFEIGFIAQDAAVEYYDIVLKKN